MKSESGGDFADTNFSGTINDLISAAEYLKNNYRAPSVIVGHSLGGATSLLAASRLEEIKAVAAIGAHAAQHVTSLLQNRIAERKKPGLAKINISGRPFLIKKQFVEGLEGQNLLSVVREMRGSFGRTAGITANWFYGLRHDAYGYLKLSKEISS